MKFFSEIDKAWAQVFPLDSVLKSHGVASRAELPDAAFAVIDTSKVTGKDAAGRSKPDSARHLPHHSAAVKSPTENNTVVLPLLRNALARMNQIQASPALKAKAKSHLIAHAKKLLPNSQFSKG